MISRIDITNGVLATLVAGTDRPVGDHEAPPPPDLNDPHSAVPYVVLYSTPGGEISGSPLGDLTGDPEVLYQVTCVGRTREQAEWMADTVRGILFSRENNAYVNDIEIDNALVISRDIAFQGGISQEGDLFNSVEQYAFQLTSV